MPEPSSPQEPARFSPSETGATRSSTLALRYLLGQFQDDRRSRVLDLGPAIGANVSFFRSYQCQLYIADFHRVLAANQNGFLHDSETLETRLAKELDATEDTLYDLILGWDLLNYLTPEQLEVLDHRLADLCHPKGLVFFLISTLPQLPIQPMRFTVVDTETLEYDNGSTATRPCPLYREPDLERYLPTFIVETSFLLRNGMQEYVLTVRP